MILKKLFKIEKYTMNTRWDTRSDTRWDTLKTSFQDPTKKYTDEEKPLRSQEKVGFATDINWNTHMDLSIGPKILSGY